jgi:hypothetical protein
MSYSTQAKLARDHEMILRVAACAATQHVKNPEQWAWEHAWALSAEPGWDAAYAYAIDTGNEHPGDAGDVINDSMILSGVQAVIAADVPATTGE